MTKFTFLKTVIAFILVVFSVTQSFGEETILGFHSDISIAKNGELTVTEKITVFAEGKQIKRGIFRDFPLVAEAANGNEYKVGFDIVSIKRDGVDEPYHTESGDRAIRIYIGDRDVFLDDGRYTYELTYKSDRQVRFLPETDELFWNVTGNFWDFPIETATARVKLPHGAKATGVVAYTGGFGSTNQDATSQITNGGTVAEFKSTVSFKAREGMTVGVQMPKGSIKPPTESQTFWWYIEDNLGKIISSIGLLIVTLFYFWNWWRIGRDPESGVIVPRWDAPEGVSPALANYIVKKGLDGKGWTAISAALLSLAVKGMVKLEDVSGDMKVVATGMNRKLPLPVGEEAILNVVDDSSTGMIVSKDNGSQVKRLQERFASAMSGEHRSVFYKHNIGVIAFGLGISVVVLVLTLVFGNLSEDQIALVMFTAIASTVATIFLINLGLAFSRGRGLVKKIMAVAGMAVGGFFALTTFLPIALSLFADSTDGNFGGTQFLLTTIIGIIMLNIVFFYLMGAPTALGREMMDGIEGLKQYLNLAEKDRMNLQGVPTMSPHHYETLLPYAVALGVEKPWSNVFQAWLATAVASGAIAATYGPNWYRGRNFDPDTFGDTMSNISTSIQDSLTEAMPAPKSSSSGFSGGGGSSGGGGGGGGGGGW